VDQVPRQPGPPQLRTYQAQCAGLTCHFPFWRIGL
jgi:hypothetical protein